MKIRTNKIQVCWVIEGDCLRFTEACNYCTLDSTTGNCTLDMHRRRAARFVYLIKDNRGVFFDMFAFVYL